MTYSIETEADLKQESSSPSSIVKTSDEQTIAQVELEAYIDALAQATAPEIEIDSDIDSSWGTLYRVWHSYHLLGTFYQAVDGLWEVQSSYTDEKPRCSTAAEAQLLIVAMSGLLVADTGIESADIDQLLDKPFDELIPEEWERSLATRNSSGINGGVIITLGG